MAKEHKRTKSEDAKKAPKEAVKKDKVAEKTVDQEHEDVIGKGGCYQLIDGKRVPVKE